MSIRTSRAVSRTSNRKATLTFLRNFVKDVATLKLPVTAAAVVATVLALVDPLGVNLGSDAVPKVTAALVLVGVIAQYIDSRSSRK